MTLFRRRHLIVGFWSALNDAWFGGPLDDRVDLVVDDDHKPSKCIKAAKDELAFHRDVPVVDAKPFATRQPILVALRKGGGRAVVVDEDVTDEEHRAEVAPGVSE
jgi:hypothetical protein